MKAKRQYKFTNSSSVSSGAYWYPYSESAPSDNDIALHFPLRAITIENLSSQPVTLILDPVSGESDKEWRITDGQTLALENLDELTFYQIAVKNEGDLTISSSELKVSARNY